jgi:flagellar biosynthesis protein FlhB
LSERGDDASRTEQPTERRLAKAREEGVVQRAHAVASGAVLAAGAAGLSLGGAKCIALLELGLRRGLSIDAARPREPAHLLAAAGAVVRPGLLIVIVFPVAMAAIGFLADMMVGGWSLSARPLVPDFARVNPLRGLRELISRAAAVELLKAVAKFAVVGALAFYLIRSRAPLFVAAAAETWPRAAADAALLWSRIFVLLSAALAAIAVFEAPYQIWAHRDRLRMTRQEIKDELREFDGSPQTKRRIRLLRRRMARGRMAAEVPKADVVVTNPEHYAAALRYDESRMRAPRLVAKGTGLVARRIREIAAEHQIPIIEAPPLARAICRYVELEDEVPAALYPPVAEVLAYVYRLRAAVASGRPPPGVPRDQRFDPPTELIPESGPQ